TNHAPQTKYWRNIIADSLTRIELADAMANARGSGFSVRSGGFGVERRRASLGRRGRGVKEGRGYGSGRPALPPGARLTASTRGTPGIRRACGTRGTGCAPGRTAA